jgi:hypothetical protein
MDAEQAISLVTDWIRSQGISYPTEGLVADRFEVGWSVYAPVEIDESDPLSFLDIPVGRSVFLVGDSGRIKEVTTSTPRRKPAPSSPGRKAPRGQPRESAECNSSVPRRSGFDGSLVLPRLDERPQSVHLMASRSRFVKPADTAGPGEHHRPDRPRVGPRPSRPWEISSTHW